MNSTEPKLKASDWNQIDVNKLLQRDQREVQRLHDLTVDYFRWFFNGDKQLFNDLLLRVCQKIHTYKPERKFSTWVYTIAKNIRSRHYSEKKRGPVLTTFGEVEVGDDLTEMPLHYEGALQGSVTHHGHEKRVVLVALQGLDIEAEQDTTEQEQEYRAELRLKLHKLISMLTPEEQQFLHQYTQNKKALRSKKDKYSSILQKLRQLRSTGTS